jgi:hypothetical protein
VNSGPLQAIDVPVISRKTIYPAPFSAQVEGRTKHRLGDHFGLANFGINLTELEPGAYLHFFITTRNRTSSSTSFPEVQPWCLEIRNSH